MTRLICCLSLLLALLVGVAACDDEPSPDGDGDSDVDADADADVAADAESDARDADVDSDEDRADADHDEEPLGLGTVTALDDPCPGGVGEIEGTSCVHVEVDCPDESPLRVELRVTMPPAHVARRGVVLFGSDPGAGYYEDEAAARFLLERTAALGFVVVQRQWAGESFGWLAGEGGLLSVSCRYATLLTWLHGTYFEAGGAFCAAGNATGAAELAYSLAHWRRGEILDLAVLTSGPPQGRVDLGCLGVDADPEWPDRCARIIPGCFVVCDPPPICRYDAAEAALIDAAFGAATPCADGDSASAALLRANSVFSETAQLDYPQTRVHFMNGTLDCTATVPLGLEYANVVTSDRDIDCIHGANHDVPAGTDGAAAILDALDRDCRPRH